MKTLERTKELEIAIQNANVLNTDGRQLVANSCKELYNLIEEGLYSKFGEKTTNSAYAELCNGNFADPFMCEKKKEKFTLYKTMYENNVS